MKGPWYISASAVRDLLRLSNRPVDDDGAHWDWAEAELIRYAIERDAAERAGTATPKLLDNGLLQYRIGRPNRYQLIVSLAQRAEGKLPQLVQVLPSRGKAGGR